jgi:NDP-sugar pyrophosphorylase family protein
MQILIPISGRSAFFSKAEFYFPKPLIEVAGTPMIEVVISHLQSQFPQSRFIFVIDPEDSRSFSLDLTLKLLAGDNSIIIEKPGPTSGALSSCLLTIDSLHHNESLVIANSDQIIDANLAQIVDIFRTKDCEAATITFESIHPRWSYVVDNEFGQVVQTFEKKVASRSAIAGFYYFKSAHIFIEAAKKSILNESQIDGLYYISSALNEIILAGGDVIHLPIPAHCYHSFYTPTKIAEYERTYLARDLSECAHTPTSVNVIIPAAGQGSRFAEAGWKKPKPFIDVDGMCMLEHVISNVAPIEGSVTVLLREEHLAAYPKVASKLKECGHHIKSVNRLTEGTALTVLLAREIFDNNQPMIVANSDQLVDFNVNSFVDDCIQRKLDGSILVFKDPLMDPKWSFVKVDKNGHVLEVAEKRPISDLATVGIYLFAKGKQFIHAALDMIVANDRVNNEFYTCPVYNYMIKNGSRIGIFEVPMESMAGLGTPNDLREFLQDRGSAPSVDSPD